MWLLPLLAALFSCANAPVAKPVPAGYLYRGDYLDVRVPNTDGWHLLTSSPAGMAFARSGTEPDESLAAQVLIFPLQAMANRDEFLSLVKQSFAADMAQERFAPLASAIDYTAERGYPCVRVAYSTEDQQAQTAPGTTDVLLLQARGLYCRHPIRQQTGFAIIYSHRGKHRYANLDSEAQEFINGVQVPTP